MEGTAYLFSDLRLTPGCRFERVIGLLSLESTAHKTSGDCIIDDNY